MNLTQLLAAQQAAYEADPEPDNYGLDTSPIDLAIHPPLHDQFDDVGMPCNYCGTETTCACIDRGSPYTHRQ